jgi:hypothetical protein
MCLEALQGFLLLSRPTLAAAAFVCMIFLVGCLTTLSVAKLYSVE